MTAWLRENATVTILVALYLMVVGLRVAGFSMIEKDHDALLAAVLLAMRTGEVAAKKPPTMIQ